LIPFLLATTQAACWCGWRSGLCLSDKVAHGHTVKILRLKRLYVLIWLSFLARIYIYITYIYMHILHNSCIIYCMQIYESESRVLNLGLQNAGEMPKSAYDLHSNH
jgi:hypothetical protein